jgi:hypothetical protein
MKNPPKKNDIFLQEIKNFKIINQKQDMKIPENGACIFKCKPTVEVLIFKKITHKSKDFIIILKKGELRILRTIDSENVNEK